VGEFRVVADLKREMFFRRMGDGVSMAGYGVDVARSDEGFELRV